MVSITSKITRRVEWPDDFIASAALQLRFDYGRQPNGTIVVGQEAMPLRRLAGVLNNGGTNSEIKFAQRYLDARWAEDDRNPRRA